MDQSRSSRTKYALVLNFAGHERLLLSISPGLVFDVLMTDTPQELEAKQEYFIGSRIVEVNIGE